MTDPKDALVLDLVEWVAVRPRPYGEVMEAWRTSCPRLTVWEDAVDQGVVACEQQDGAGTIVKITQKGRELLRKAGRLPDVAASPAETGQHSRAL